MNIMHTTLISQSVPLPFTSIIVKVLNYLVKKGRNQAMKGQKAD